MTKPSDQQILQNLDTTMDKLWQRSASTLTEITQRGTAREVLDQIANNWKVVGKNAFFHTTEGKAFQQACSDFTERFGQLAFDLYMAKKSTYAATISDSRQLADRLIDTKITDRPFP